MKHLYAVRIDDPGDSHPNYVGPLNWADAQDLSDRLHKARRSYEMGPLLTEAELPGLWQPPEDGETQS